MLASPIFIVGYMHSGTTLLQQLIGKNEHVYIGGGETRHFSHLDVIERKFPDLEDDEILFKYVIYILQVICTGYARVHYWNADDDPHEVITSCGITDDDVEKILVEAKKYREYAELLGVVYDYLAVKSRKKRWLDKAPSYIMYINRILKMYPDARVIDLVRDPRDVLTSKWRRAREHGDYEGNYDPVWDTLAWRSAVRAGNDARVCYPENILRVRYEDLVINPRKEAQSICKFLELDYNDSMLSVEWINTSTSDLKGAGIGTKAIGKWRSTLPLADVYICQQLVKGEMADNNYVPESIPSKEYTKLPLLLTRSIGEFTVRLYKKRTIGGKRWTPEAG